MAHSPVYILGGSQTDFSRNWNREGSDIYGLFEASLNDALASNRNPSNTI